jgi:hypothetical protein
LEKNPARRMKYEEMVNHGFLKEDEEREVDVKGWVEKVWERRRGRRLTD